MLALLASCNLPYLGTDKELQARREDLYQKAIAFKQNADCPKAIPLLEPFAARGHGFEVAQYQLGQCYLETAQTATSPAEADQARTLAAQWIIKAAESDLPGAQEQASRLYADGHGVAPDPIEAGKWLLLAQRNPMRRVFGPVVIDPELEQSLRVRLTPSEWEQARARAARWHPIEQPTNLPPAETKKSER